MDARGVVTSINRADRVVNCLLDTGEPIEATYLGEPPWPMSTVALVGDLTYLCLGPIGDRRRVFHDDFMAPTTADTVTSATVISDIGWSFSASGTGSTDAFGNPGTGGAGVRRLIAPLSSSARIRAANTGVAVPPDGYAAWMSGCFMIDQSLYDSTTANAYIGLGTTGIYDGTGAGASDRAVMLGCSGVALQFRTYNGTSTSSYTLPDFPAAATYYWFDIVTVSGEWAAMWFDGTGPYVITTDVPADDGNGYTPFARLAGETGDGVTVRVGLDALSLAIVSPAVNAIDYALAVGSTSWSPS